MSRRLRYLDGALDDLAEIFEYITRESGSQKPAWHFVRQLRTQCARLAELPGMFGRLRPELAPDIRSVSYKGYILLLRYHGDVLEVVNVIEGHRHIPRHFQQRNG